MSIFQTSRDTNRVFYLHPVLGSFDNFTFEYAQNGFDNVTIGYSFSHDRSTWSEWFQATQDLIDSITTGIDNINTYVRISIVTEKLRSTNFCSFEITEISVNGIEVGVEHIEQGSDSNIIVNSKSGNRFDPYRKFTQQQELFAKMSRSISDIFSFECVYFKVMADEESESVVFKSYRLKNVIGQSPLNIVIKNNHLPGNRYVYSELDIDFQDEVEIHIVKEVFTEVFGEEFEPETNDFLYLPLTDRMYEVNTASQGSLFMNESPYWKAFLIKYENRDNVQKPDGIFDDIPLDVDTMDHFKMDIADEEIKDATKPFDGINFDGSDDFITKDAPNINGFHYSYAYPENEEFSKSYYLGTAHNTISVSFWMKFIGDKQIMVITGTDSAITTKLSTTKNGFKLELDIFELNVTDLLIETNKWVGVAMNISKLDGFASLSVYDEYGNLLAENSYSSLSIEDKFIHSIILNSGFVWTNFRSFEKQIIPTDTFKILSDPLPSYGDSLVLDNPTPNLE